MGVSLQKIHWLLPIISGVLLSLTLPSVGMSFFVWICLVPLFWFIEKNKGKTFAIILGGFITGTIYFMSVMFPLLSLNSWWWFPQIDILLNHKELILFLSILLFAMWVSALFTTIFSVIFSQFYNHTVVRALFLSIIWGLLEFLREFAVFGFTWGHIGYSLHGNMQILQLAHFLGVYGISSLIILVNILIFSAIFYTFNKVNISIKSFLFNKFIIVGIFILILSHLFGFYALQGREFLNNGSSTEHFTVSIVNSPITTINSYGIEGFKANKEIIKDAFEHMPDILIMPENTFPFFIIDHETKLPIGYDIDNSSINKLWTELSNISSENSESALILGAHSTKDGFEFNSIIVMEDGLVTNIYNKRILMPFSEIPTKVLSKFHVQPIKEGDKSGVNSRIVVKGKVISPLICSEVIYPHLLSKNDSLFIINISNDGMFDGKLVAEQNHIMAKFRAVENRQYIFRSVKNGISSIINPYGDVVISSQQNSDILILTKQIFF